MRFRRGASKSPQPAAPPPPPPTHVSVIDPITGDSLVAGATPAVSGDDHRGQSESTPPPGTGAGTSVPEMPPAIDPTGGIAPVFETSGEQPSADATSVGTPVATQPATSAPPNHEPIPELAPPNHEPIPELAPPNPEPIPELAPPNPEPIPQPAPDHGRWFRRRRGRHRRARSWKVIVATLAVIAALLIASGIIVTQRLDARPPLAVVRSTLAPTRLVAGSAPALPWPAGVQSAIAIPALGITAQSGPEVAEPIASVTKLMTAHIVLTDHPLTVGEQGPTITITPLDVTIYEDDVASDQANIEVAVGEVLTEHQLLEGMLVHSANNFADLLAISDAGSISAFVTKMNSTAASLGMTDTQYADPSGYLNPVGLHSGRPVEGRDHRRALTRCSIRSSTCRRSHFRWAAP